MPLYHASLPLALELTTAILLFLQNNPKIPTYTSGNTQTSCETLLVALVSGILVSPWPISHQSVNPTILHRTSSKRTPVARDVFLLHWNRVTDSLQSVKIREIIASSLYPILCPTYILAPHQSTSLLHPRVAPLVRIGLFGEYMRSNDL